MKNKIMIAVVSFCVVVFSGCSDDQNVGNSVKTAATIKYNDDSIMGVTRKEDMVNGGFSIYSVGTGDIIGFIGVDGVVNDSNGNSLGICAGAEVSDAGVSGDCQVPAANPAIVLGDCPDTRNGDFNPSYSPAVCNENGYFWCSLSKSCLDKPVNVPQCGEIWER